MYVANPAPPPALLQTAGARTQAPCVFIERKGTFMNTTCGVACLPREEGTYAPGPVTYSSNAANSDCYCAPIGTQMSRTQCARCL